MKHFILPLFLFAGLLGTAQVNSDETYDVKTITRVKGFDVVVTVDSLDELESTFKIDDINEIFEFTDDNITVSFKLVCNGDIMKNGKKSHMSYKVEGNSSDQESFLKRVIMVREAGIEYFKNKE